MNKTILALAAALLAAGLLPASSQAAPPKAKPAKMTKMVSVYQADRCHMDFTAAQAKKYNYACPDSKGKMKKVMLPPAAAKAGLAQTAAALAPKKAM